MLAKSLQVFERRFPAVRDGDDVIGVQFNIQVRSRTTPTDNTSEAIAREDFETKAWAHFSAVRF